MVPSRIAMNVAPSTSALPAGSSSFLRWSGRIPYLIGPNSVAITPNRNNVTNMIGIECSQKPTTPSADTAISTNFTRLATIDLSKRSASCPPKPERKKKGPMKMAAVSVISASRLPTPGANRIRNTSAFFRKLSLNAEKNWHQNKGAKRRDVIRLSDMLIPLGRNLAVLKVDSETFADGNGPAPGWRHGPAKGFMQRYVQFPSGAARRGHLRCGSQVFRTHARRGRSWSW